MKLTSCTSRGELASSGGLHQPLSAVSQPCRCGAHPGHPWRQLELQHELNPQTFEGTSARSSGAAVVRAVGRGEDEATTP